MGIIEYKQNYYLETFQTKQWLFTANQESD